MSASSWITYRERDERKARARRAAKTDVFATVVAHAVLVISIATLTFALSSLSGHSMMEKARRDYVRAVDRSRAAKQDLALQRERVDRLCTMGAIERWAVSRGFTPPVGAPARVARKDGQSSI